MWCVAAFAFAVVAIAAMRAAGRVRRAERSERAAVERRDRFLSVCAGELRAPLETLRAQAAALDGAGELERGLDELAAVVAEAAELPRRREEAQLTEIDLAELTRDVLAQPPFSTAGPSVILRASPAPIVADRARLAGGVKLLLWVVRRDVDPSAPLVVTVGGDAERALLEIDARGAAGAREVVERDAAVGYGLAAPVAIAPPGATLAVRVAAQVARLHGGRVSASSDKIVLELPARA
jgi:hypothetical protein